MDTVIAVDSIIADESGPTGPRYVGLGAGRILSISDRKPSVGTDVRYIDGAGCTLVPGLIDAHVHLAGVIRPDRRLVDTESRLAADALDVASALGRIAAGGITGLRDCGFPNHSIFAVRMAAERGQFLAPRMTLSGRAICAVGGHGASVSTEVDGPDATRRAVRTELKAGAEWIKLMVTGGTATPGEAVTDVQLTLDEMSVAVAEAHARGRKVSAHCSNTEGTHLALIAGVDSIEHGIDLDDECVGLMVKRSVWLSSTVRCTQIEGEAGPDSRIPVYIREKAGAIYRQQMQSFQRALAAGVPIVASTDAEQPYLPLSAASLVDELVVLVSLGMEPLAAIGAATWQAATMLGWAGSVGRVRPDMAADLLLVEGNPLDDLHVLAHPREVFVAGRRASEVDRAEEGDRE